MPSTRRPALKFKSIIYFASLIVLLSSTCLPSCSSCSSNGQCTQCITNNYLTIASQPSEGCLPCPPSCKTCNNEYSSCIECATGYYYSAADSECFRCGQNCAECDQNNPQTCLTCEEEYYLISTTGVCQHCSNYEYAVSCRQNIILTCESGYYVSGGQKCVSCPENCKTCTTSTFCIQCEDGFYGASCEACESSCLTCINGNTCITCGDQYYLDFSSYLCKPCNSFPNCQSCLSTGQCISCSDGYYLTSDKECNGVGSESSIQECSKYHYTSDTFSCTQCNSGYYLFDDHCLPCSLLCLSCNGFYGSSQCSECAGIANLVQSTVCLVKKDDDSSQKQLMYMSEWNFPDSFQKIGTSLLISQTGCPSSKLTTSIQMDLGIISGYEIVLTYQLVINLNPNITNSVVNFQLNEQDQGNVTINGGNLMRCSLSGTDVYVYKGMISLDGTILASANNKIKIIIYDGFISLSEAVFSYKPCHSTCKLCSSYYECTQCADASLYIQDHACVQSCSDLFYLQESLSICTKTCSDGTYQDTSSQEWKCITCNAECQSCSSSSICIVCADNYYLYDGNCLETCPSQYYGNAVSKRCQSCEPPCYTCNSADVCTSCSFNFLNQGNCVGINACATAQFANLETMSCEACVSPCETCSSLHVCSSCEGSMILHQGNCLNQCPLRYIQVQGKCSRCQSPCYYCEGSVFNCIKCESGFLENKQCLVDCPSSTYKDFENMQCVECQSPCSQCSDYPDKCTSCVSGFVIHLINQQCLTTSECIDLVGSYYDYEEGTCSLCLSQCSDCSALQTCVSCSSGYFLIENQCLPSCPLNMFANEKTHKCENCSRNCLTCSHSADFCTSCPQNYALDYLNYCFSSCLQGKLPQTCEACDYPCSSCVNITSYCTSCVDEYYFSQVTGQCLLQCYPGYYQNQNYLCQPCLSPCERCMSGEANKCTFCGFDDEGRNYYLKINDHENGVGECIDSCPSLFFKNWQNGICQPCTSPCKECISESECVSCLNGYLEEDYCVQSCSFGRYSSTLNEELICSICVSPCFSCESQEVCLTCIDKYYLYGSLCLNSCPEGTISLSSTGTCEQCSYPCSQCSGSTQNCLKCDQPANCSSGSSCIVYLFWQNSCLQYCPSISFQSQDTCVPCISPCYTCTSSQICTSCIDGHYLLNGICSQTCIDEYYPDSSAMECRKCLYPCLKCLNSEQCIDCMNGVFYSGTCLLSSSCPSGYYQQFGQGSPYCAQCNQDCLLCSQNSQSCLSCSNPLEYLLNGQCLSVCYSDYYPAYSETNEEVLICSPCFENCDTCSSQQTCTKCVSGYFLMNGGCVDICPPSYFYQNTSCQSCSHPCSTCFHSSTNCLSCVDDFYLYQLECIENCPIHTYTDEVTEKCRQCEYPCEQCNSSQVCTKCLAGFYLNEISLCLDGCPSTMTIDSEGIQCIDNCPQDEYKLQYFSYNKCSKTCDYPYILYRYDNSNQCISNCTNSNLYINQNLQCVSNTEIDHSILTTAQMKVIEKEDSTIQLLLTFSHEVDYELLTSLHNIIQVKVYLEPQYANSRRLLQDYVVQTAQVDFEIETQNSQYILISLQLGQSVNGQLIQVSLKDNSNLLIKSKISSIPLQSSSFQATLPRYEAYPTIYMSNNFKIFGQVIVDFVLIIAFFLFLWNWYAKIYEFLHLSQFIFLLATLEVAYPPNLNLFLQGFKWSHFYQIGNWFMTDDDYSQITDAPKKIAALFIDANFMRIYGHIFCLCLLIVGVFLLAFGLSFLLYCSSETSEKIKQAIYRKLMVIKWSHIHDLVMSFSMISVFAFFVQINDYEPNSSIQVLGIIFSYIVVFLILVYYIYMGHKLYTLVELSQSDPQRFCDKNYLFRDNMMSIVESAVHPKQLYLNYLRAIRIVVIGGMVGLFNEYPNLCLGSFIIMLLASATIYLMVKPYPQNLQNVLLGSADIFTIIALIFIVVIDYNTEDNPSQQNLEIKWGIGWGTIIMLIINVFLLMIELVVSIIRGNSSPHELPAEDLKNQIQRFSVPRKIYVYDKKEFPSWSCDEGSALNVKKTDHDDHIKQDK